MKALKRITRYSMLAILVVLGCVQRLPPPTRAELPDSHPLHKTEPNHKQFSFDPSRPFHLDFGRGGGLDGLDTVSIDEMGRTILHRRREVYRFTLRYGKMVDFYWEKTEIQLPKTTILRLGKAVIDFELTQMARAYHAQTHDGTQWIFWLRQENQEMSIYFDNHFPKSIQAFARFLDYELHRAGLARSNWRKVPKMQYGDHDKAIWRSIE